jgi:O-antigen chain-terminating methyltransferase
MPDRPDRDAEDFLGEAARARTLEDWHELWSHDRTLPIRSHRGGLLGRLLVAGKKLLRPLVKTPQADLWDRQRVFNLALLEYLVRREGLRHEGRIGHLENFVPRALDDLLRHNDALFARVDQKMDRHRREAGELLHALGGALAVAGPAAGEGAEPVETLARLERARDEQAYVAFERRFRGTEEEIRERVSRHVETLEDVKGLGDVLDLGCGRGEAVAALREAGLPARGVDASAEMVRQCAERGLPAEEGDLFEHLAGVPEGSLGAVVSFHVIEHLPATSLDRLARLAWRALAPGGALILETPSPLSLVVAARSFWLDPTHLRPVHPDTLVHLVREAGIEPGERLDLSPFEERDRLPEIDLASVPEDQRDLADKINRLRDTLDDLLFGYQDYAVVGRKPG